MSRVVRALSALTSGGELRARGTASALDIPSNGDWDPGARNALGAGITEKVALSSVTVLACVRGIVNHTATLPLYCTEDKQDVPQVVRGARVPQLLRDPFPLQGTTDGLAMSVASMALRGTAYWKHLEAVDGYVTALEPLHPDTVRPDRDGDGIRFWRINGKSVPWTDVTMVREMVLPGSVRGIDPISYAASAIGLALGVEDFGAEWFENGASPSGVLQTDADLGKDEAAIEGLARRFAKRHTGRGRRHKPLVLDKGLKWQAISVTPEQAQFLATRGYQRGEIAGLFGVPLHWIGSLENKASQGGGKGLSTQTDDALTMTIRPKLWRLEKALGGLLPDGFDAWFDTSELSRMDPVAQASRIVQLRTAGTHTVNELRREARLPPVEGGDVLTTPLNSSGTSTPAAAAGDKPDPALDDPTTDPEKP